MIDLNTAIFIWSGQVIAVSLVLVSCWLNNRKALHFLYFALGFGTYALGALLVGLRAELPVIIAIQGANSISLLAFVFWGLAICAFDGRPASPLPLIPVAIWMAGGLVPTIQASFLYRTITYDLASVVGFLSLSILLLSGSSCGRRTRLLLVAVFAFLALNSLSKSVNAIVENAEGFADLSYMGVYCVVTVASFATALLLFTKLVTDRTAQEFAWLARHDPLTDALNRRGFEDGFSQTLRDNPSSLIALALFDVDHFKAVNDAHGHGVGDEVLRLFATTARRLSPPNTHFGRMGGEEFALVMPVGDVGEAVARAEAIRQEISELSVESEREFVQVTISAGVAAVPAQVATFDRLMSLSDKALYLAKERGRNTVVAWSKERKAEAGDQSRLIDDQTDRQVAVLQRLANAAQDR